MRIAYLGKFKIYWDEECIADALEQNGASVLRLPEDENLMHAEYLAEIDAFKPDVFLCAKLSIDHPSDFLRELKKRGIPTVSWTFDLLIGHPPRERVIRSFAFLKTDLAVLTDGGRDKEYADVGVNKATIRQGIPERYNYRGQFDEQYDYDVAFVGTMNPTFPYRQKCIERLRKEFGPRFHWFGKSNPNEIRGDELNKLYASAKVVVGDSMFGDDYWSNRVYETLGRGGMLMMPAIKGLEREFEPFKHYIPYGWGDFDRLVEQIKHLLDKPDKREAIQQAAFEYTRDNYTYTHRTKKLMELIHENLLS